MMTHDHLCKVAALAGCLDPAWGLFAADKAFFMHLGGGCCSLCLQMWNWNVKHQRCRLRSRHEVLRRRGRCLWCRAMSSCGNHWAGLVRLDARLCYPLVILHNYGKSPCLMGKSTIPMAIFNSYFDIGVSENSVPLNPMVNDHYPY
jgi:hypothetical protein